MTFGLKILMTIFLLYIHSTLAHTQDIETGLCSTKEARRAVVDGVLSDLDCENYKKKTYYSQRWLEINVYFIYILFRFYKGSPGQLSSTLLW